MCCGALDVTPLKAETVTFFSAWNLAPDYRDGLAVFIGERGSIVLKQSPMCADEQAIYLHPSEAEWLLKSLPSAIAAARGEGATHG